MNLLSLDLSTKTGHAYFENNALAKVGTFTCKVPGYVANIKSYKDFPEEYPGNFLDTADYIAGRCMLVWHELGYPDVVIEHTEGSSHRISQRTLEWIHSSLFRRILEEQRSGNNPRAAAAKVKYILNSDWRRETHCYVSQWPEFKKFNAEVGKLKRKATPTKSGAKVAKLDGKIVSKWDGKKISIHIAKLAHPEFADQIITDDIADAINMGDAALKLKMFEAHND